MRNLYTSAVVTSVKAAYRNFSLDLAEDLMGTQKLIRLMCPIMGIFQKGNIFVCDEIYFTNINPNCRRTTLKPLSAFVCYKDKNVQKKYLKSKCCKVMWDAWEEQWKIVILL